LDDEVSLTVLYLLLRMSSRPHPGVRPGPCRFKGFLAPVPKKFAFRRPKTG
jgi:hypothetical protein